MRPRIAFYAPLKPPTHPTPSGDRRFARLLLQALRQGGFDPILTSTLRSRNSDGSPSRQRWIETRAREESARILARILPMRPRLWMTYHLYYKAPDLLGPAISRTLGIPYVAVEASRTPSKANGVWRRGHAQSDIALRQATLILQPNPKDFPEVEKFITPDTAQVALPPFLNASFEACERPNRMGLRASWAERLNLDVQRPWMLATGMMRTDQKRHSFLVLAEAVRRLSEPPFHLILIGDGPARSEIEAAFGSDPPVRFAGALPPRDIRELNAAADLFVWPAIGEAFGMALLEAQAAGLPAVIGDRPGTRALVRPEQTALLCAEGDAAAFTQALSILLADPERRARMAEAAFEHVATRHDLKSAAALLRQTLTPLLAEEGSL